MIKKPVAVRSTAEEEQLVVVQQESTHKESNKIVFKSLENKSDQQQQQQDVSELFGLLNQDHHISEEQVRSPAPIPAHASPAAAAAVKGGKSEPALIKDVLKRKFITAQQPFKREGSQSHKPKKMDAKHTLKSDKLKIIHNEKDKVEEEEKKKEEKAKC